MSNILPIVFTILMVAGNALVPKLLNKSISTASNQYEFKTKPAGFTFSIWGVIYAGLLLYSLSIFRKASPWSLERTVIYGVSCLCNCLWIYLYINERFAMSALTIYAIIGTVGWLWWKNYQEQLTSTVYQNVLATYLGWVIGAGTINTATVLNGIDAFNGVDLSVGIVGVIAVVQIMWHILTRSNSAARLQSSMVPVVGLWTAIGIMGNKKWVGLVSGGGLAAVTGTILSL